MLEVLLTAISVAQAAMALMDEIEARNASVLTPEMRQKREAIRSDLNGAWKAYIDERRKEDPNYQAPEGVETE